MTRMQHRLKRLDMARQHDAEARSVVVWIKPDGSHTVPAHLHGAVRMVYLPRKSRTAEEWSQRVAARFPQPTDTIRGRVPEEHSDEEL